MDSAAGLQKIPKNDGMVVNFVARGVKQGQGGCLQLLQQSGGQLGLPVELGAVAAAKFHPTLGNVAEPAAQAGAGGDLLQPEIAGELFLGQAPGPETIHQYAETIVGAGGVIDTPEADGMHGTCSFLPCRIPCSLPSEFRLSRKRASQNQCLG
jgi:hypothetical protein